MLQEENYSGKKLIVGDLEVIGNMTGSGITEIKRSVDTLQNSVESAHAAQSEYWGALSSDGFISPVEKKQLRKEWDSIVQVHSAVMAKAQSKGMLTAPEVIAYDESYKTLDTYLNTTLKLFESMGESTAIESKKVFDHQFAVYYYSLENAQNRINIGDPGQIRHLQSLMEDGVDGEAAIYERQWYIYVLAKRKWIYLNNFDENGDYQGVVTQSPPQKPGQYFLVGPEGIPDDFLEFVIDEDTKEEWVDQNGELIFINIGFEPGYIYYWDDYEEVFKKLENRDHHFYHIAEIDLVKYGYPISTIWYDYLIDTVSQNVSETIIDDTIHAIPKYLGAMDYIPTENIVNGDYLVWKAYTTPSNKKGHVYVYQEATRTWAELDPDTEEGIAMDMFMTALNDICDYLPENDTYYASRFAKSFFATKACTDALRTIKLFLRAGGFIQSENYKKDVTGFFLDGDTGNMYANNVDLRGKIHAESGEFNGDISADDLIIKCEPGNVILSEQSNSTYETEITKSYIVPCKGSLRCFISFPSGILAYYQTLDNYIRVLVNNVEKYRVSGPPLVAQPYFDVTVNPNDRITLAFKVNAYDHSGARPAVITYTYYFGIGSSKNQNLLKFLIEARNRTLFG